MIYVIIGVVFLLILAPIFAILPSAEQKARMVKRKHAMSHGVRVELTHIEDPDPDPEKYLSNTGKPLARKLACVAYRLQRARTVDWQLAPSSDWALARTTKTASLRWDNDPDVVVPNEIIAFIEQKLTSLPNDVVRVEEKKYTISVYWKEVGEVQETIDFLKGCAAIDIMPAADDEAGPTDRLE